MNSMLESSVPLVTVTASVLDQPILVAAAGVVVVLAILLVFVMVLRNNGANKRTSMGLGYDPQQGPLGQSRGQPSQPNPYLRGTSGEYGATAGPSGQNARNGAPTGWGQNQPRWDDQSAPPAWGNTPQAVPPWQQGGQSAQPWGAPGGSPSRPLGGAMGGMSGFDQRPSSPSWDNGSAGALGAPPPWAPPTNPATPGNNPWGAPAQAPNMAPPYAGPASIPASGMPPWGAPPGGSGQGFSANNMGPGAYPDPRSAQRPIGGQRMGVFVVRSDKDTGRAFELRKDRMTVGRSRDSDIFLEDLAVSRTHITVFRDDQGRYILHDENSANGTFLNGQRVTSDNLLEEGDEVQIGKTILAFARR